jgi:peroxiredoxin
VSTILSGISALLGAMFLIAAITKLAGLKEFAQTVIAFGAPRALAGPLAVTLAGLELGIAAAFLLVATAWWGSVAATLLLSAFTIAVAVNVLRGRRPPCNCFGQLSAAPIGWITVFRNAALAGAAGWLAWQGHGTSFSALTWDIPSEARWPALGLATLAAAVAALAWLILQLTKQNGRLLLRVEALETQVANAGRPLVAGSAMRDAGNRTAAPAFALPGLNGEIATLQDLLAAGRRLLLVFSDPDCGPCTALMPHIAKWQQEFADELNVVVVSRGSVKANRAKGKAFGVNQILLQKDSEIAEAYSCSGTPGALLVAADGSIDSPLAMGQDAIVALVNRTIGGQRLIAAVPQAALPTRRQLRPGETVPRFELFDLNDGAVDLGGAKSDATLLIFWNPACGFCRAMLGELQRWDAIPPGNAARLVLISTGSAQDNTAMALRCPIILDGSFALGQLFGAAGTPSAVLLDAGGAVASKVAAGREEVMALVDSGKLRYA